MGESPVDLAPGEENPVRPERTQEEIIVYSPSAMECVNDDGCPMGQRCYDVRAELRVSEVPEEQRSINLKCGQLFAVNPTSDMGLGQCTSNAPALRPHEYIADEPGTYRFDLLESQRPCDEAQHPLVFSKLTCFPSA